MRRVQSKARVYRSLFARVMTVRPRALCLGGRGAHRRIRSQCVSTLLK